MNLSSLIALAIVFATLFCACQSGDSTTNTTSSMENRYR